MTTKIGLVNKNNKFWEAIFGRVLFFLTNHKLGHLRNQASYHLSKITLECYINLRKIAF